MDRLTQTIAKHSRPDLVDAIRSVETERLGRPVSRREVVDSALLHHRGRDLHPETVEGNRTPLRYRR